jgi:hypothetical protein
MLCCSFNKLDERWKAHQLRMQGHPTPRRGVLAVSRDRRVDALQLTRLFSSGVTSPLPHFCLSSITQIHLQRTNYGRSSNHTRCYSVRTPRFHCFTPLTVREGASSTRTERRWSIQCYNVYRSRLWNPRLAIQTLCNGFGSF